MFCEGNQVGLREYEMVIYVFVPLMKSGPLERIKMSQTIRLICFFQAKYLIETLYTKSFPKFYGALSTVT